MNVELINPFLVSLADVLSTMAKTDVKPDKPALKKDDKAAGEVTGVVALTGKDTKGSLAITFTQGAIVEIASNMVGEIHTEINDDVIDAVGEITNMVCGGAKKILSEKGYKFDMAIPTVISGKGHIITHRTKGPVVLVPFQTSVGNLFVEVCFEQ